MSPEDRDKLIKAGREDLIKIFELNKTGYAGILPNGNIVDRREHKNAIPIQENSLLNIPKPKDI